ncbi:MAG: hypothetical protein CMJ48_02765, partial [Planctomycetaceae bacterium]|nr:hypothetical protein [Planctomycetaceae bacterium]
MQHHRVLATVRFVAACLVAIPLAKIARAAEPLRFARDVRPILSSRCFPCHGPDGTKREAELRLDERAHALKAGESGEIAIVAGKPEASEFVRRLFSKDAEEAMPPTDSNKTLTAQQKEILRRWVAEGATFEGHWAMTAPRRAPAPPVRKKSWPRNAIDHFILARLEREGLEPSAEAEHPTLIRRLSLDLTGLPPTPEDVGRFEREMTAAGKDAAPSAAADLVYETWVNKLLDSPHYGERMAVDWLDAARFADTNGYQV